jgi:hypothetical protein
MLTIAWLRHYPIAEVLGYLLGVSECTASRAIARVLPVLEAAGRLRRKKLADLLADTPELALIVDGFEQPIGRPTDHTEADSSYSGKKKRHTLKVQVAVDEETGEFVEVSESFPGPTADIKVLEPSGLPARGPPGVGLLGDRAYVGMGKLAPTWRRRRPAASRGASRGPGRTSATTGSSRGVG